MVAFTGRVTYCRQTMVLPGKGAAKSKGQKELIDY